MTIMKHPHEVSVTKSTNRATNSACCSSLEYPLWLCQSIGKDIPAILECHIDPQSDRQPVKDTEGTPLRGHNLHACLRWQACELILTFHLCLAGLMMPFGGGSGRKKD